MCSSPIAEEGLLPHSLPPRANRWHYVRSLTPSFSVSFWWGARMGLARVDAGCRAQEMSPGLAGGASAASAGDEVIDPHPRFQAVY
jgi:hypothetical protein